MAQKIDLSSVETVYKNEFGRLEAQALDVSISAVLQLAINVYENTKIAGVDASVPDNDMLLFEYGMVNMGREYPVFFKVSFTRQFCIGEEEEYYQLALTFSFGEENFVGVESFNAWSVDYSSIEEWKAAIQDAEGFQRAEKAPLLSHAITLDYT